MKHTSDTGRKEQHARGIPQKLTCVRVLGVRAVADAELVTDDLWGQLLYEHVDYGRGERVHELHALLLHGAGHYAAHLAQAIL